MTKYSQTLIIKQALYILRERELERERKRGDITKSDFHYCTWKEWLHENIKRMPTSKASKLSLLQIIEMFSILIRSIWEIFSQITHKVNAKSNQKMYIGYIQCTWTYLSSNICTNRP